MVIEAISRSKSKVPYFIILEGVCPFRERKLEFGIKQSETCGMSHVLAIFIIKLDISYLRMMERKFLTSFSIIISLLSRLKKKSQVKIKKTAIRD
ncbi:MAG: hypothetical protein ACTSVI_11875 [Promethearchaeota archaeon]